MFFSFKGLRSKLSRAYVVLYFVNEVWLGGRGSQGVQRVNILPGPGDSWFVCHTLSLSN